MNQYQTPLTLPAMVAVHARTRPKSVALAIDDTRTTWRDLHDRVEVAAGLLAAAGLRRGARLALLGSNSLWSYVVFLGAARSGVAVVPVSHMLHPSTVRTLIVDSDVDAVAVCDELSGLAASTDLPSTVKCLRESDLDVRPNGPASHGCDLTAADLGDDYSIIYSSGTTGTPKGIVHTHGSRWGMAADITARLNADGESRFLLSTPIYSNGSNLMIMPWLMTGGFLRLMPKFDAAEFSRIAVEDEISHAFVVPTQIRMVLDHLERAGTEAPPIEVLLTAGSPLPLEDRERVWSTFGHCLYELWGLTEGVGTMITPEEMRTRPGAVGHLGTGTDVRLVDENGAEVLTGVGEIVGRSPRLMKSYLNRPDLLEESTWTSPEGTRYFRTGDLGEIDDDRYLWIRGRRKDIIISGGFNVYPIDIEKELRRTDGVADAAVFGIPDPKWGEVPVAYVTLEYPVDSEAVRQAVNSRLSKTQRLVDVVVRADDLPRNSLGKPLKTEMRDEYLGGAG